MKSHVTVVTGGGSGIGAATVRLLAARDHRVAIFDRNAAAADALVAELGTDVAVAVAADVADVAAIESGVATVVERFGGVDGLVNNAGYGIAKGIDDTTADEWDALMATNVKGAFVCTKACIAQLRLHHGAIVNVGSVAGQVGLQQRVAYCASKAAIHGMTKALAVDLAADGVRVNAVAPGTVMGPYYDRLKGPDETVEEFHRRLAARQLMNRCGEPDEIAEAIAFLLSDAASYATGSILVVDGGLSAA